MEETLLQAVIQLLARMDDGYFGEYPLCIGKTESAFVEAVREAARRESAKESN